MQPYGCMLEEAGAMDEIFRALADPSRRRLLDSLNTRTGQTLRELCAGLDMARQSVSKHLAVLEAANLVSTAWRGREKLHYLNAVPINSIAERWISRYDRDRTALLSDLKHTLEGPVTDPEYVYTTFINSTPERLWRAITDPAFTRRYWGVTFDTDWRAGSPMTWHENGVTIADPAQQVIESEPYRRLAYSWHTITPEYAAAHDMDDELRDTLAGEPRSTVTFDLEPQGPLVKLTVTHGGFAPDSTLRTMIGTGWPALVSSLKTLLETGEPLPTA
jgi:uncharacterized protein YndB with AHSA1/START domain/DNA-binding transcriptional ArsR family regulator